MNEYPEHQKLAKVKNKSQSIGEFLDWCRGTLCELHEHTIDCEPEVGRHRICGLGEGEYVPMQVPVEKLLAEFFDIDLARLEDEKRAMLDELGKAQA